MLTEICKELNNWFAKEKIIGMVHISDGHLDNDITDKMVAGQYFRIVGSVLNDGVHKYDDELVLQDEEFEGAVWLMAVPPQVLNLANEIKAWQDKYGAIDSENMSPFNSESFGGYSYSKSGGGASETGAGTWQKAFRNRLNMYRKVHPF